MILDFYFAEHLVFVDIAFSEIWIKFQREITFHFSHLTFPWNAIDLISNSWVKVPKNKLMNFPHE